MRTSRLGARRRGCVRASPLQAIGVAALVSMLVLFPAPFAWSQTVLGRMPAHWIAGADDCSASQQAPLQVHNYEPQTYILRQNPCANFEANFIYLLIGSDRALLIDTGAIDDAASMPLATTVQQLLPQKDGAPLPLLVVHSHSHLDHYAGDAQFASISSVQIVGTDLAAVRSHFGLEAWPEGAASFDLGNRVVHVVPAPGHKEDHVVFYDERTAILFSGDSLMPGRLLIEDIDAFRQSADRVKSFLDGRPLTHILGGHIERDVEGRTFPFGDSHHPNERPLELAREDLLALPAALATFNGFHAEHENYSLSNPMHNLAALAAIVVAALVILVFAVRALLRARRRKAHGAS